MKRFYLILSLTTIISSLQASERSAPDTPTRKQWKEAESGLYKIIFDVSTAAPDHRKEKALNAVRGMIENDKLCPSHAAKDATRTLLSRHFACEPYLAGFTGYALLNFLVTWVRLQDAGYSTREITSWTSPYRTCIQTHISTHRLEDWVSSLRDINEECVEFLLEGLEGY